MERAQVLHQRLRLDDPQRDVWITTSSSWRNPGSHQFFARSRTFAAPAQTQEDFSPTLDQSVNSGLVATSHETLNDDSREADSRRAFFPHPHRPMALSYPIAGTTRATATAKKQDYPQQGLWRSKTEYVDGFHVKDFDDVSTSGVGSSAASSSDLGAPHGHSLTPLGVHPDSPTKKRRSLDILQLCEHMKTQGLGEPLMSTSSHVPSTQRLPPGVKARRLPRDPSTREKIKGRARLDYELANLRAVAFCEQQHPRTFRTASANLRWD